MTRCERTCPTCRIDPTLMALCIATVPSGLMPEHEHACTRDHRWSTVMLRGKLPRELKAQADLVRNWTLPIGTPVDVHQGNGSMLRTKTRSEAWLLGGHTAVIHVDGLEGAYVLERVERVNAGAEAHFNDALHLIEDAQNRLREACEKLSPVIGMSPEWRKLKREHDRIKKAWYALDARRQHARKCTMERTHNSSTYPCASCTKGAQ